MESGAEPPVARRRRCDEAELADAFDDASWEISAYLDLDTCEVIPPDGRRSRRAGGHLYRSCPRSRPARRLMRRAYWAALERRSLPAWMHAQPQEG
jgi:hypothetical protein